MLLKKDPDLIKSYLEDYSNMPGGFCEAVAFAESEQEVCDFLRGSSQKNIPVTLTAAGTGVTGGRVPFGGYALSMEKMNRILDIKKDSFGGGFAIAEPGVVLSDFLKKVSDENLFYPPDPTEKSSFLSGNIATSASGARSFKYGTTRDYVLGLRVVLSSGEIIDIERGNAFASNGQAGFRLESGKTIKIDMPKYLMPCVKNAAGYFVKDDMDLIDLFIGQEGTLGVITKIKLKLLKRLTGIIDCYCFFNAQADALNFVDKAKFLGRRNKNAKDNIGPISLEFFNRSSLKLLRQKHSNIPANAAAAVYFEQESSKETESDLIDRWAQLIEESGGSLGDTWFAQNNAEQKELQAIRHDLPDMVNEFIKKQKMTKIGTDIAVGHSHFRDMIGCYDGLLTEAGLRYVIFGHIGDSHLHVNILPQDKKEYEKARDIYNLFVKRALIFGGTISAEHGIGKLKHKYLEMMYGIQALKDMACLKKSLDPACILGLGNIFPKELLE